MEELKAPVPCPRKLFCLAGNYLEHIEEGGGVAAPQDKETPRIFMKPPSSTVVGPGGDIRISPVSRAIDWEGELAVVMGGGSRPSRPTGPSTTWPAIPS